MSEEATNWSTWSDKMRELTTQELIDRLTKERDEARARVKVLEDALRAMTHAVCGETGFAECVRRDSGQAYPWPALEIAETAARAAMEGKEK
jgi:hypothetical protein